jgi:hypothetical protein
MRVQSLVRSVAAAVLLFPVAAFAQASLPPAAVTSNGVYFWADGSYRSINLPAFPLVCVRPIL